MPDDLKHYRAPIGPLGVFQLIAPAITEMLIVAGIAGVIVFGVLPDIHAWIEGRAPVGACK